ncbi:VOC family protein [Pollutibacter soli]|uniref:VOC family protein n=1 Tax=Pollutibacter soli TaxID=3034157 RepID=UPI003013529B
MIDHHSGSVEKKEISITLEPWIHVSDGSKALHFYTAAFDVVETFRMEEGGLVLKLNMGSAAFWISGPVTSEGNESANAEQKTIRMVLTVPDPEVFFAKAIKAGAKEIFPVTEEYGWLLGRVVDPFGIHWEIGHPL